MDTRARFYSDDQPRDDAGRWSDGGSDWGKSYTGKGEVTWDYPDWALKDDGVHVYRGVTSAEYDSIVDTGQIKSTGAHSLSIEGTQFAREAATALSYAHVGRDNPALTGKPVYVVEVKRTPSMTDKRDGYVENHGPTPTDAVTRVWRFNPDGSIHARSHARRFSAETFEAKPRTATASLVDDYGDELAEAFEAAYREAGSRVATLRGTKAALGNAQDHAEGYARTRAGDMITDIDDTTRDRVGRIVGNAMRDGLSKEDVRGPLKRLFGETRADLIARTETSTAYNIGTVRALRDAGEKYVYVSDPDTCGEEVCDVDGEIWTLEEAEANPLGHPNCGRDFRPLTEEELAEVKADEGDDEDEIGGFAARLVRIEGLLRQRFDFDESRHPRDERGRFAEVAIDKVGLNPLNLQGARENVAAGRPSKTAGPIHIEESPGKVWLLEDGYHRLVEAHARGDKTIAARITPARIPRKSGYHPETLFLTKKGAQTAVDLGRAKAARWAFRVDWGEERFYSEDQERDDHGRWTDGGGVSDATEPSARTRQDVMREEGRAAAKHALDSLADYKNYSYRRINDSLRGTSPMTPETRADVKNIDSLFKGEKERGLLLYRGDGAAISSTLFEKAGIDPGRVSIDAPVEELNRVEKMLNEKLVGAVFTDKAFVSTSRVEEPTINRHVPGSLELTRYGAGGLVEIYGRGKAIDVDNLSGFSGSDEKEWLLQRGTKFEIEHVNIRPHPDGKRLYLRWRVKLV